MTGEGVIRTRRLGPDEVLEGLRDVLVRTSGVPRELVAAAVGYDTPLDEVLADGDPSGFARVLELYFGTGRLPDELWGKVGEFGTVRGLCHALARFVEVPVVEPVTVLGRPCPVAGAFEVVRRVLDAAGADVSDLRPSTPMLPYLWVWPDVFRWQLPRLAPGRVPEVRFHNRRLTRRILGVVIGLGGLLFGLWLGKGFPVFGGIVAGVFVKVFLLDLLLAPWAARRRNWSVDFGGLYDFRDLAAVIAGAAARPAEAAA